MSDKTALWDKLGTTDPKHTKGFKRAGGFSGTAIKPMYSYLKMTEEFGACGVGWGINQPSFQVVPTAEEILVYCTVSIWHGNKENTVFGVGGDKVAGKNKYGVNTDDEAFKKAFTDAITNALKLIGVGADVHMGLFDDSKYVNTLRDNPHVTRPADIVPSTEYDENGEVVDNIPHPSPDAVKKLRVVDQRPIFEALQKEIHATTHSQQLQLWAGDNKDRLGSLKADWQEILRGVYREHLDALRDQEQGDRMRASNHIMAG